MIKISLIKLKTYLINFIIFIGFKIYLFIIYFLYLNIFKKNIIYYKKYYKINNFKIYFINYILYII